MVDVICCRGLASAIPDRADVEAELSAWERLRPSPGIATVSDGRDARECGRNRIERCVTCVGKVLGWSSWAGLRCNRIRTVEPREVVKACLWLVLFVFLRHTRHQAASSGGSRPSTHISLLPLLSFTGQFSRDPKSHQERSH